MATAKAAGTVETRRGVALAAARRDAMVGEAAPAREDAAVDETAENSMAETEEKRGGEAATKTDEVGETDEAEEEADEEERSAAEAGAESAAAAPSAKGRRRVDFSLPCPSRFCATARRTAALSKHTGQ